MNTLPTDVRQYMCKFMDPATLVRLSQVSKSFQKIALDDHLWIKFTEGEHIVILPPFNVYQHTQCLKDENVWKRLYLRRPCDDVEKMIENGMYPLLELYPWRWIWHVTWIRAPKKCAGIGHRSSDGKVRILGNIDESDSAFRGYKIHVFPSGSSIYTCSDSLASRTSYIRLMRVGRDFGRKEVSKGRKHAIAEFHRSGHYTIDIVDGGWEMNYDSNSKGTFWHLYVNDGKHFSTTFGHHTF